jgi:hypothetical protein
VIHSENHAGHVERSKRKVPAAVAVRDTSG